MKTTDAINAIKTKFTNIFQSLDFLDGSTLSQDQIKTTSSTLFWFIQAFGLNAGKKEKYIVYSIDTLRPKQYGDGVPLNFSAIVTISIYSRTEDDLLVASVETEIVDIFKNFSFERLDYDNGNQLFVYTFSVIVGIS